MEEIILEIARDYLLDRPIKNPHGMCIRATQELSLRFKEIGLNHSVVKCFVWSDRINKDVDFDEIEHFFIRIGRKILDVTASQFKDMPVIYYGSLPMWYRLE